MTRLELKEELINIGLKKEKIVGELNNPEEASEGQKPAISWVKWGVGS